MNTCKYPEGRGFTPCCPSLHVHNAQHTVGVQWVLRSLPTFHASVSSESLSPSPSAGDEAEEGPCHLQCLLLSSVHPETPTTFLLSPQSSRRA